MKLNKLFLGLLGMAAFTFAACSDDDDYTAASVSGEQVFFPNNISKLVDLKEDATSFTVPVQRYVTSGASTVNLTVTDPSGKFNIPTSVEFADGEKDATITIGYDPADFEYAKYDTVTIAIENAKATPYGISKYTFAAGVPEPFESLGIGKLEDNWYFEWHNEVEILQNKNNPNVFRIMKPYHDISNNEDPDAGDLTEYLGSPYWDITLLQPGNTLTDQTITENDLVYFTDCNTGYHNSTYDADIYVLHPSRFNGSTEKDWLHSKVIAYQENGLPGQIQIAPRYYMFGVGGWNQSQEDGIIIITFPGYNPKDYSLDFAFTGRFTDVDDADYMVGNITLGEDIESAKYMVTTSDSVDIVLAGLADGSIEGTTITSSSEIKEPLAETGTYFLAVVGFAEGAAVAHESFKFKFSASGQTAETWTAIYVGDYLYGSKSYNSDQAFFYDDAPFTEQVTLYVSDSNSSLYKVLPWCASEEGLIFTMNDSGIITVDEVDTGHESSYGEIFASDIKTYGAAALDSYYENGVFHFNLAFHVPAGVFSYEENTLTLTGEAQARLAQSIRKGAAAKKHITKQKGLKHWMIAEPKLFGEIR